MIGIPFGYKKVGIRETTADVVDNQGWTLTEGQRFFVLELKKYYIDFVKLNHALE